jgi:hypothetical protein
VAQALLPVLRRPATKFVHTRPRIKSTFQLAKHQLLSSLFLSRTDIDSRRPLA